MAAVRPRTAFRIGDEDRRESEQWLEMHELCWADKEEL